MIRRTRRATRHRLLMLTLIALVGAGAGGLWALTVLDEAAVAETPPALAEAPVAPAPAEAPPAPAEAPPAPRDPRVALGLDPARFEREGDHYIQRLEDGRVVHLTLDPAVQRAVERLVDRRRPPQAGFVAIEPATGRVLALVSRTHSGEPVEHFALRAQAPSASVFKLVTAAALLERAHVDPEREVCYSGGRSHLTEEQIKGDPARDTEACADLGEAIGRSINPVLARLAYYHLSRQDLEALALRFGFNREIPFELPVEVSEAVFVDDDIERARTAAGFWNVNLSPLHGALIAAAISNDGVMMRPTLVDRVEDARGQVVYESAPEPWLVSLSTSHARTLAEMGEATTTTGTAAKQFQRRQGWPDALRVTGKTGTLANKRPYLLYTWFVGAAPIHRADIAVGSLVANGPRWWIKGMHCAADAILAHARSREGGDE